MSAFLCSAEHLSALVSYAATHTRGGCSLPLLRSDDPRRKTDADHTFGALLAANLQSLSARYGEKRGALEQWFHGEPGSYRLNLQLLANRKAIDIVKLCDCFSYQACEYESWETSDAAKWINAVREHAIRHLPGYEEAPWGL